MDGADPNLGSPESIFSSSTSTPSPTVPKKYAANPKHLPEPRFAYHDKKMLDKTKAPPKTHSHAKSNVMYDQSAVPDTRRRTFQDIVHHHVKIARGDLPAHASPPPRRMQTQPASSSSSKVTWGSRLPTSKPVGMSSPPFMKTPPPPRKVFASPSKSPTTTSSPVDSVRSLPKSALYKRVDADDRSNWVSIRLEFYRKRLTTKGLSQMERHTCEIAIKNLVAASGSRNIIQPLIAKERQREAVRREKQQFADSSDDEEANQVYIPKACRPKVVVIGVNDDEV